MITFKRGDSFDFTGVLRVNAAIQDLTGFQVQCALRLDNSVRSLVQALTVSIIDAPTAVLNIASTPLDTIKWPIGQALIDIRVVMPDGYVVSSSTVPLTIIESIAHV